MIRIFGGRLRGRKILVKKGETIRPTINKTRNAIFDLLQNRYNLKKFEVFDLFAGSGALGFEAYSRGVDKIFFIENDRESYKLLLKNLKNFKLNDYCFVFFENTIKWLRKQKWNNKPKLFLIDPPYLSELAQETVDSLSTSLPVSLKSVIVVETAIDKLINYPEGFSLFKKKEYVNTRLDFLEVSLK